MPEEREDVEATLEQGTTPDASQQKGKWRAIDWIAGNTLVAEALLSIIWVIAWAFGYRFEHQLQVYLALVLFILTGGYLALIFCPIFKKDDDPRWFHARILSSGIVGGSYAFLLPAVMSLEERGLNSGGAAALRQAILLATGGLIGLIALGETRRKNDNDREAAENLRIHQQDTLDQQKDQFEKQLEKQQEQFDANAFKDRKAERRERYTKAVEQLGDEKAPVRVGGVYTLVGLVDEWLEEESIRKYEDRLKEGQVIINNLCAYIRSPFTLASHYDELMQDTPDTEGVYQDKVQEFYADKATLESEADVRLSIIKEIHDRLQGPEENTPGTWSDFEYDFSGSVFFYSVDLTKSYYKNLLISAAPPTRAGLTSPAPPTRVGLTSPTPPTRPWLTSPTPPTRAGLTSPAPPTGVRLTSAGLFSIVTFILVHTFLTTRPVLQNTPLLSITKHIIRKHFLVQPIMVSQ